MKKSRPKKLMNGKSLVTTPLVASDDVMDSLAFKYLKNVYPILRIKIDGKFKRTIIVNGMQYSVSKNKDKFIPTIINDISLTFAIEQLNSKIIVFDYFKIKAY